MKKIIAFDYIRTISISCIILCHCCFGIDDMFFLGAFLRNTFNVLFLILSAFLLGEKYQADNFKPINSKSLAKRIQKLAYSYYPFIFIMFTFLYVTRHDIHIKDIVMHITFLPWFNKLEGFGHLWFITLIVFCYISIYIITNMPSHIVNLCRNSKGVVSLLTIAIISQIIIESINCPNYLLIYIIAYILVFTNSNRILCYLNKISKATSIIPIVIIIPIIFLYYNNKTNTYTSIWLGITSAIIIFQLLYKIFNGQQTNKIVTYISSISFEIYLVHHIFCFGKYSIYKIINNPVLGTITIFIISFLLAYILNLIKKQIQHLSNTYFS